jgi:hypothetical protein
MKARVKMTGSFMHSVFHESKSIYAYGREPGTTPGSDAAFAGFSAAIIDGYFSVKRLEISDRTDSRRITAHMVLRQCMRAW